MLDLGLELGLQLLKRDRVLVLVLLERDDLDGVAGVIDDALRSAGSDSYAFLLKPNSAVVPGSCQPG